MRSTATGPERDDVGLTVLTWNVQNAAAARSARQADWLAASGAHVAVLTEVSRHDGGQALASALRKHGFRTHSPGATGDNGVLIAVRDRPSRVIDGLVSAHLPHRLLAVRLGPAGGDSLALVGLYVPSRGPRDRRNVDKRAFQAAVSTILPDLARELGDQVVVTGDLNVVEPGHDPAHGNFGAWEYEFYQDFGRAHLIDAFRRLHPEEADHSWYGRRSALGYRFDHLFCSDRCLSRLTSCQYDHTPRLAGLSDHAALVATFAAGLS